MAFTAEQEAMLAAYADTLIAQSAAGAKVSADAAAVAAQKAAIDETLAPVRQPMLDAVAALDAALQTVYATDEWR